MDNPEVIYCVSGSPLSLARFKGSISFNGNVYYYNPVDDTLIRADVLKKQKVWRVIVSSAPDQADEFVGGEYRTRLQALKALKKLRAGRFACLFGPEGVDEVRTAHPSGSSGTNPFEKAVVKVKSLSSPTSKGRYDLGTLIPDPKNDEPRESDWWDQVLSTLSPGSAKILRMRFLQELDDAQISKIIVVSRQRVWQIQQKALQQLRVERPGLEWEI